MHYQSIKLFASYKARPRLGSRPNYKTSVIKIFEVSPKGKISTGFPTQHALILSVFLPHSVRIVFFDGLEMVANPQAWVRTAGEGYGRRRRNLRHLYYLEGLGGCDFVGLFRGKPSDVSHRSGHVSMAYNPRDA